MTASQKTTFNFQEILQTLDSERQTYDLEFLKLVDERSHDTELTYAETILFIEGGNLGIADCTLPPYVFYESDSLSGIERDSCIRSEFLEWCLDASVSKTLLKNGLLKVEGATILSALDFNAYKYSYEKVANEKDEEYSLDLSNRNITVDLTLKNCIILKGMTIKDSYTENIILERIRIGKTYDNFTEISLNATNSNIKGDLKISGVIQPKNDDRFDLSLQGNIVLDYAIIENSVLIKSEWDNFTPKKSTLPETDKKSVGQFSGLSGNYMESNFMDISGCHFHGSINLYSSKIKQAFLSSRLFITKDYGIEHMETPVADLSDSYFQGMVSAARVLFSNYVVLSGSRYDGNVDFGSCEIGKFYCLDTVMYGLDGLILTSSKLATVWFDNSVFYHGVYLRKSEISIDLDCQGAYFGYQLNIGDYDHALRLNNSKICNAYFDKGCVFDGGLDLTGAEIESLNMQNSFFHDVKEKHEDKAHADKGYAIRANNLKVAKVITFNPTKTSRQEPYKTHYYTLFRAYGKFTGFYESTFLNEALDGLIVKVPNLSTKADLKQIKKNLQELKNSSDIAIANAIKEKDTAKREDLEFKYYDAHFTHANTICSYGHLIEEHFENLSSSFKRYSRTVKALQALNEVDHHCKVQTELIESPNGRRTNRYSIAYGEVCFEGMKLTGNIDCAGGIFFRRNIANINNPIIGKKKFYRSILGFTIHELMDMKKKIPYVKNALTLSHSNVDGSVYLNNGDEINRLPFIAQGEIDMQYSYLKHLYITPFFARKPNLRWNLIGLNYEALTLNTSVPHANKTTSKSINRAYDWIFPYYDKDNFRQPFEQLASSLFKNGSDTIGRLIIVNRTPSRGRREALLMFVIRTFFWLTFPLEQALITLSIVIAVGIIYFKAAWSMCYMDADKGMEFQSFYFALQKLVPVLDGEQEKNFIINSTVADGWFEFFYNIYPLIGTFILSMIILNLARMRKNSE